MTQIFFQLLTIKRIPIPKKRNFFETLFFQISGKLPAAMQTAGGRTQLSQVLAVALLLSNLVRLLDARDGGERM